MSRTVVPEPNGPPSTTFSLPLAYVFVALHEMASPSSSLNSRSKMWSSPRTMMHLSAPEIVGAALALGAGAVGCTGGADCSAADACGNDGPAGWMLRPHDQAPSAAKTMPTASLALISPSLSSVDGSRGGELHDAV